MSVLSHSESELYSICFFWIFFFSVKKIMTNFEIYSQPDEPVGKLDQLVY